MIFEHQAIYLVLNSLTIPLAIIHFQWQVAAKGKAIDTI